MNTATAKPSIAQMDSSSGTMFWRFVWKEFRMLRGLWLAVAILGALVQLVPKMLQVPASELPFAWFATALSAAVLYTVGAAATSFCVEHEEETYDFLSRLPARWRPLFVAKLLVTVVTAVLLAATLSITGWAMYGFKSVNGPDAHSLVGMLGFAIFEALVWGTLFSLLIKRPLLAAIVTLVTGIVAVNVAVNLASRYSVASLTPEAYVEAIPLRLAIVAVVLVCGVALARGWLSAVARPAIWERVGRDGRLGGVWGGVARRLRRNAIGAAPRSDRRMMARLLWQTWRECWKLLLLPLLLGGLLLAGIGAAVGLSSSHFPGVSEYIIGSTLLFVPALYGAMVFYCDQRRRNYQFLAEHAARPRCVWFARNAVWLGSLVVVGVVSAGICLALVGTKLRRESWEGFENYMLWGSFPSYSSGADIVYEISRGTQLGMRIVMLGSFGGLVAYSLGQLCSMAVRSEIMAAFLALLLSCLVTAWVAILYAWQLSVWLCLLPLLAGFMLATWLRAPDWIAGRNSMRAWLKPAIAAIGPIVIVGLLVPGARLAQIPTRALVFHDEKGYWTPVKEAIAVEINSFEKEDTPEARETAQMYIQAADHLVTGPVKDLLTRWEQPDIAPAPSEWDFGIDESKIPPDELDAFHAAKKQQLELIKRSRAEAIQEAIKVSKRPACRIDFDIRMFGTDPIARTRRYLPDYYFSYKKLDLLLNEVVAGESFDHLLAGLRMSAHLRSGQPSVVFIDRLRKEQDILALIGKRAAAENRSAKELRSALDQLTDQFRSAPGLEDTLLADHLLVRNVLTGKDDPFVLAPADAPIPVHVYLAYMANRLPWERERALEALDRITLQNIRDSSEFVRFESKTHELAASYIERWLPRYGNLPARWEIEEPAATTSYLAALEYKAHVSVSELNRAYCNNLVCRRAAILQIALAIYRFDHKEYPPRLADLVPEYLTELPFDPYSGHTFQFERAGLDLPLEQRSDRNLPRIAADTPFIWSVGAWNVRLVRRSNAQFQSDEESEPDHRAQHTIATVYVPMSDEWPWEGDVFAFPLRK